MERTKIQYRFVEKNRIEVVGFTNASTLAKIAELFGLGVAGAYVEGKPYYRLISTQPCVIITSDKIIYLCPGQKYSRQEFGMIVSSMKESGCRLQRLIKESKKAATRTLEI